MKKRRRKLIALAQPHGVTSGHKFSLDDFDPSDTGKLKPGAAVDEMLAHGVARISDLQEKLYADDRWSLLLIFQAMDAAGKDGTIKHVMSGINPAGCQVTSFKAPSEIELDHDFLWRTGLALPQRGRIGIFNRSYYEEVLVVHVHQPILQEEKIPPGLLTKHLWDERFEDINAFERHLARNGTLVRKFFLHLSKEEQKKRLLARLDEPRKNWKFSTADLRERARWDDYQDAYEKMIAQTATPNAPWYVVPADHKWYTHLVVAGAVIEALESLELEFPKITRKQREALGKARASLQK